MFNFGLQDQNIVKKFDDLLNLNQSNQSKAETKTEEFNFDFGPAEGITKTTNN